MLARRPVSRGYEKRHSFRGVSGRALVTTHSRAVPAFVARGLQALSFRCNWCVAWRAHTRNRRAFFGICPDSTHVLVDGRRGIMPPCVLTAA